MQPTAAPAAKRRTESAIGAPVVATGTPDGAPAAPAPLVGEQGVPMRPSAEAYGLAEQAEARSREAKARMDKARGYMNSPLYGKAARLKARGAYDEAHIAWIAAEAEKGKYARQAKAAEQEEAKRAKRDDEVRKQAEKAEAEAAERQRQIPVLQDTLTRAGLAPEDVERGVAAYREGLTYDQALSSATVGAKAQKEAADEREKTIKHHANRRASLETLRDTAAELKIDPALAMDALRGDFARDTPPTPDTVRDVLTKKFGPKEERPPSITEKIAVEDQRKQMLADAAKAIHVITHSHDDERVPNETIGSPEVRKARAKKAYDEWVSIYGTTATKEDKERFMADMVRELGLAP